ncbi:DUF7576 family protein [Haloprofundus salinisoli]|uniref:DUF7576 family protein n=1 Tax=Haloprofundus salinisoli TaxID=2876193 RepID=UPI001CCEC980|nr:hypothetical protein [Haloprofundus salinisoli]
MGGSESTNSTRSDRLIRAAYDAETTLDANDERGNDSPRGRRDASFRNKQCEHCGATIDTSEWYPVVTVRNANRVLQIYPLCGDDCREEWNEAHHR